MFSFSCIVDTGRGLSQSGQNRIHCQVYLSKLVAGLVNGQAHLEVDYHQRVPKIYSGIFKLHFLGSVVN